MQADIIEVTLHEDWIFRQAGNSSWFPAHIPSTVHLDLLANQLIPDPYFDLNQLLMYQLEDKDWEYSTHFNVSANILTKNIQNLIFEGVDTHADIYLNEQLLIQTNNMHRTWIVDVKNKIKQWNALRVYFHSAIKHDLMMEESNPTFKLPFNYSYSRKASYQYGWDWGPRLVTCGLWRDIKLQAYNSGRIESFYVRTLKIMESTVELEFVVDLHFEQIIFYQVQIQQENSQLTHKRFLRINPFLKKSTQKLRTIINKPKLWWPRGYGDQSLHEFSIILLTQKEILDQKTIKTGIRQIDWVLQDEQDGGQTFYAKVNGQAIYMKGANYIPPDMFMPRAHKNQEVYHEVIKNAVEANYNTLRLWGGGQFEHDIFYELCDQNGLLIWHDLMFACAFYPGDKEFLANVKEEIKDNIKRLRIHPSIALWNGNNEVEIGWKEWGWKNGRTDKEIEQMQKWYEDLFQKTIGNTLKQIDPDTFYWPTSPSSSFHNQTALEFRKGDLHFWGVWAEMYDIETYSTYIGRFNSEYGMQAAPDFTSIKKFTSDPEEWDIDSYTMQIHERHILGWPNLKKYITNYFRQPAGFENTIYVTQILQYLSLETAITSLRSAKPYNMGSLYWQINDVWPVVSWATVDYYGCWKAGHYAAKRFHNDPLVTVKFLLNNNANIYVINDLPDIVEGDVQIKLITFGGSVSQVWNFQKLSINNEKAQIIGTIIIENLDQINKQVFLSLAFDGLFANGTTASYNGAFYFTRPLEQQLQEPNFRVSQEDNQLIFKSKNLVRNLYIGHQTLCLQLSDNYFDLIPGEEKIIQIMSGIDISLGELNIYSLWDTYQIEYVK